jgi:hypothetical protein
MSGPAPDGLGHPLRPAPTGGTLRDELALQERRRRRAEIPTVVGLVAFGALIAVAGHAHVGVVFLGVWILGLGAVFGVARRSRSPQRASRVLVVPTIAVVDATPATVIPADGRPEQLAAAVPAWTGIALAALSAAVMSEQRTSAYLTAAAAAGFIALAVRMAARARRPGLWMTPTSLVVRDARGALRVDWVDVVDVIAPVSASAPMMLRLVTARQGRDTARAAAGSLAPVRVDRFGAAGVELARVIQHYRDPTAARELGTDASLRTVAGLLHSSR